MAVAVRLPKMSDEMTEATVSRWLKSVGESVDKGEPIVEVETEKVIVEVEAPRAGIILEILVEEQEVVAVDGVLCRIGAAGEKTVGADTEPPPERLPSSTEAPPEGSNVVPMVPLNPPPPAMQQGKARGAPSALPAKPALSPVPSSPSSVAAARASHPGAVVVSPLARRVAEELGFDLTVIAGTGIGGKIVMADLQPYVDELQGNPPAATEDTTAGPIVGALVPAIPSSAPSSVPPSAPPPLEEDAGGYSDVSQSALRRSIGKKMSEAKGEIPHFYMTAEIDVTELLALRDRLNASLEEGGEGKVSVNDLMIKAVAQALEKVPALNATFGGDSVRRFDGVHIAFATAIPDGLVTPVVRNCQRKTVGRIARETAWLIDRARRRQLAQEDLQGGTFTISNLGMYPVAEFSAIINPPQVGILAIARPVERPAVRNGQIVPRRLMNATLSADHRAVDGVTGAEFLQALRNVLEHPERLIL